LKGVMQLDRAIDVYGIDDIGICQRNEIRIRQIRFEFSAILFFLKISNDPESVVIYYYQRKSDILPHAGRKFLCTIQKAAITDQCNHCIFRPCKLHSNGRRKREPDR
jgi:hypothetical protein